MQDRPRPIIPAVAGLPLGKLEGEPNALETLAAAGFESLQIRVTEIATTADPKSKTLAVVPEAGTDVPSDVLLDLIVEEPIGGGSIRRAHVVAAVGWALAVVFALLYFT